MLSYFGGHTISANRMAPQNSTELSDSIRIKNRSIEVNLEIFFLFVTQLNPNYEWTMNVVEIVKWCITDFVDVVTTDDFEFIIAEFPTVVKKILTLDKCCRVPMTRNSVFSSLRRSLSCSIHERMSSMQFCMAVIASCWLDKSLGLKEKYICESSA